MKNMSTILMHVNSIYILAIYIPSFMGTSIYYQAVFPCFMLMFSFCFGL